MSQGKKVFFVALCGFLLRSWPVEAAQDRGKETQANTLGISFIDNSRSTLYLDRDGKRYLIDVEAKTIREAGSPPQTFLLQRAQRALRPLRRFNAIALLVMEQMPKA